MMRITKNNAAMLANEIEDRGLKAGYTPEQILKEQFPVISGSLTRAAFISGDVGSATFCTSMAMGLIHDVKPVKDIIDDMVREAEEDLDLVRSCFVKG